MTTDAIVVMDAGTAWPTWIDEGTESNVAVLARHDGEGAGAFEARASGWLEGVLDIVQPSRAVLVAGRRAERWTRSILRALAVTVHQGRGRSVVLASSGDHAEQRHLAGVLRDLSRELEMDGIDIPLQLRIVAPNARAAQPLVNVA